MTSSWNSCAWFLSGNDILLPVFSAIVRVKNKGILMHTYSNKIRCHFIFLKLNAWIGISSIPVTYSMHIKQPILSIRLSLNIHLRICYMIARSFFIKYILTKMLSLEWRHNGRDGVSNHQPHDCLLSRLFCHWPLWGEFTDHWWIPRTKDQLRE